MLPASAGGGFISGLSSARMKGVYIMYDFDQVTERRGTASMKYDGAPMFDKPDGLLPLWVADMDFQTADPVKEAVIKCAEHGIYGYSFAPDSYYDAVIGWFSKNFGFTPEKRWIVTTPGVVCALATAVNAFTKPGDSVIVNRPVYYPFSNVVVQNDRKLVNSPLVFNDGRYEIDFEDFEQKIIDNNVKMYILCSPHNPVGRVWSEDELRRIGDICLKHNVIVVADEIHCDFVWTDRPHVVYASLGERYADNCIVCTAPSKTFNLAGLQTSNIFIPNADLRKKFRNTLNSLSISSPGNFGITACEAAYSHGEEWLNELRAYLRGNIDFVRDYLNSELSEIKLVEPEGLYLLWLDMRSLAFNEEQIEQFITDAGLWLDGGTMFGPEGLGFQRINAACPRSVLRDALERLKAAVKNI